MGFTGNALRPHPHPGLPLEGEGDNQKPREQSRGFFMLQRYPSTMLGTLKTWVRVVFMPVHLKRTLLIAFVVGSWLNLFNHGDVLLRGAWSAHLALKLALNYVTPFVVANVGLLARLRR